MIGHILNRKTKQRCNLWYKDNSDRGNGTMCGVVWEGFGWSWADRNRAKDELFFPDTQKVFVTVCPACAEIRDKRESNK